MPRIDIDHDLVERIVSTRTGRNFHRASFIPRLAQNLVELHDQGVQPFQIIGAVVDVLAKAMDFLLDAAIPVFHFSHLSL